MLALYRGSSIGIEQNMFYHNMCQYPFPPSLRPERPELGWVGNGLNGFCAGLVSERKTKDEKARRAERGKRTAY